VRSLRHANVVRILIVACVLLPTIAAAQVKNVRRVLVIYELGLSSPTISLADREIRNGLEASPYQVELYAEYLEVGLFPDEASQRTFREHYIRKYQDRKPDVIHYSRAFRSTIPA
jgi:hypothetical protein